LLYSASWRKLSRQKFPIELELACYEKTRSNSLSSYYRL